MLQGEQAKVHLKRLEELEYLLVHRDRDSRRHFYELLYQKPAQDGTKVLAGLLDVEQLRQDQWSGPGEKESGDGRGKVGSKSAHGRHDEADASARFSQAKSSNGQQVVENVNAATSVS